MRLPAAVLTLFLTITPLAALVAQVDTIDIHGDLLLRYLPEGRSQYSVSVMSKGTMKYVGLWDRTVRYSTIGGKECIIIEQDWSTSDSLMHRSVRSISSRKDFSPIYHWTRDGKGKIDAFNFSEHKITGSDTTADNSRIGFEVPLSVPTLNWELDLEVFQMLPYAKNKTFVINFYHPGGPPPSYYDYVVSGEETLAIAGGGKAECWILSIDYKTNTAKFWVDKRTHEVLKSLDLFPGGYRYKVKLTTETKDS